MIRILTTELGRSERGAALIEMALVAPVLAVGVIGIVDISNAYSEKLQLEQGAQRAIEKIMQTTANDTVENTLADEACKQVDGLDNSGNCLNTPITAAANVVVTWKRACMSSTDFSYKSTTGSGSTKSPISYTTSTAYNADSCSSGDKEADYLQLKVSSNYTPMFPIHFTGYTGSAYPITATAGVRIK